MLIKVTAYVREEFACRLSVRNLSHFCLSTKMSTTAVALLFILVGYSLQQDAIDNVQCDLLTQLTNDYCLSTTGFTSVDAEELTEYGFCSDALALTQCIDASCMSSSVREAVQMVVPALNRAHICPACYDEPVIVSAPKETCTVWGQHHVVPFDRQPETCLAGNASYVIFSNPYFTITAESNATTFGVVGISGVRFDYTLCAVFSRTWRKAGGWNQELIPTQGWFPHTIHITQNSTQVLIELPALNTEILISASAPTMSVSVSTGISLFGSSALGVCMGYCTSDYVLYSSTPLAPCTAYPTEFRQACMSDLINAITPSTSLVAAVAIDTELISRANTSSLGAVEFQKTGLPLILTLVPTAIMVGIYIGSFFWRRKAIKRAAETMNFSIAFDGCCNSGSCCCCCFVGGGDQKRAAHKNLESAPIRAIWCWIVFCLNPHVLGIVFPFTGMTLVSAFCGIWILAWVGTNHKCIHFGSSKFTLKSIHITKALLGFALPQQVAVGIIGAAASEYYLIEVQFWWGLGVLFVLLAGGIFMCFLCLDISWAAKILNGSEPARQEQPMQPLNRLMDALADANRVDQRPVVQQHVVQVQQLPPMRVDAFPQAQQIAMQQGPVVPPPQSHVIMPQQQHVMQPQQGYVVPPPQMQEQPRPQSHVIEAQPIFYGNPSEAPPPPMSGGAFNSPSPVDVYQNPGKYMAAPDANQFMGSSAPSNSSDTARQVAKRAIKIAGIEVDPVREGVICDKIQELLLNYNLLGGLYGDDSRAASLRNDLAKNLAEELKMYRNDSIEDLAFGLKEAVLLWKDEHQL